MSDFIENSGFAENIEEMKAFAQKNDIPIMFDDGIEFICNYIREHKIKRILEIGTAIAYSAIRFASIADDIYVTTIEIDIDRFIKAQLNIKKAGLENRITAINEDALFSQIDGEFDLIFIDAAKAQYMKFFEKYKENLAPGGVFISDNLSFHGMVENLSLTHNYSTKKLVKKIRKYIAFLKANTEFKTDFYQTGDGIAVSYRAEEGGQAQNAVTENIAEK